MAKCSTSPCGCMAKERSCPTRSSGNPRAPAGLSSSPALRAHSKKRESMRRSLISLIFSSCLVPMAAGALPVLKVGVTLHPYYSWTKNVVGALPGYELRAILPGEIDAGDYQPRPEDIKKLVDLDAIVINGIGHDDFIKSMLKASGNSRVKVIRVNDETPQIHSVRGNSP